MVVLASLSYAKRIASHIALAYYVRKFVIRDVRYVNYLVVIVVEIAIRFLSNLAQESLVSYPEFT